MSPVAELEPVECEKIEVPLLENFHDLRQENLGEGELNKKANKQTWKLHVEINHATKKALTLNEPLEKDCFLVRSGLLHWDVGF